MNPLNTPLQNCTFVAFDFETTGLSASRDRALELGAVRFQLNTTQQETYSQLYQPERDIPDEVVQIHGITAETVKDAPRFVETLPSLLQFFQNHILVAHHAAFDLAFLASEFRRANAELPSPIVVDTFHLARRILPGAPSYSLGALIKYLNLEMGQAHRALPDAEACAALLKSLIQKVPEWESLTLQDLLKRYPQARVGFLEEDGFNDNARVLQSAILEQKTLHIAYRNSRGENLKRCISPLLLGGYGDYAYVEAFCHLRNENRQFRLNRIQKLQFEAFIVNENEKTQEASESNSSF